MNINSIGVDSRNQFFPTPKEFLAEICEGMQWGKISTILEPSAGKGDIVEYLHEVADKKKHTIGADFDIDVIEKDEGLRILLKGKSFRVIHDDFLTFNSFKKYDLIIMNPPFMEAEDHLLKALNLQKDGGSIICIMNAETIRNPYSTKRKHLKDVLEKYNADISFHEGAFRHSENPTDVEVAVIKVMIPEKELSSEIFEKLRNTENYSDFSCVSNEIVDADYITAIIQQYNLEIAGCKKLIEEYEAMKPYILEDVREGKYSKPILELNFTGKARDNCLINSVVRQVRKKYWAALFQHPRFTCGMTSAQVADNMRRVEQFSEYDFSHFNIKTFQIEMVNERINSIETCIVDLFDELSHEYSWLPETGRNIHYYNGWATNKAHIINKKVIIPVYDIWSPIWKKLSI